CRGVEGDRAGLGWEAGDHSRGGAHGCGREARCGGRGASELSRRAWIAAMNIIRVRTRTRCELVEVTDEVASAVRASGVREGVVVIQSLHTTAGLTINENADPDVVRDLVAKVERLVPKREDYYRHAEGNSDSHLKTSLFG